MLLDTHALLWFGFGQGLSKAADMAIDEALLADGIYVSAVSAWEIETLVRVGRPSLSASPEAWFEMATAGSSIQVVSLDADTAFAATNLPGDFHRDPADRFLVATARSLRVPIVTRDRHILAYAAAGHVQAVAC
ncbi:type II toxin-antitoxin system VapC family toxin [uncultured Enterovirga sp.]|uniref:type II toxin-antitoxin system VapC family toxin n=1 Tax=uncultured Enterovirga sp. TaxID=2026352 RepID=UPI0035CB9DAF